MIETRQPSRTIEVAAGLIWNDGRLLLCRRPEGKPMAGLWEFPGGKLEPGETAAEALTRELGEELGIEAGGICLYETATHHYEKENLTVILHFLNVQHINNEPQAREGQKMAWLAPGEALNLPVLAADAGLLRRLSASVR